MSNHKPLVLILVDYYLPGNRSGGTLRTTSNLIEWLGEEYDFRVLTKDRDLGDVHPYPNHQPGIWYALGKAQIRYLAPPERNLRSLAKILSEIDYDLLYLNSVFSNFTIYALALMRLNQLPRKPTILTPHGSLSIGSMNHKRLKKHLYLPAAYALDLYSLCDWHASSDHETSDIVRVFGKRQAERISILAHLPTPVSLNDNVSIPTKRVGEAHIVFLSRISKVKNLDFFLESLRQVKGKLFVDIWGPVEDRGYWNQCQQIARGLPVNIVVDYRGIVAPQEVINTLRAYHLFYLPTTGENFGYAILEALCAGCPVLISDRTLWKDLQANNAGWAFPLQEPTSFQEVLQYIVDADEHTIRSLSDQAHGYGTNYITNTGAVAQMSNILKTAINS